MRKYIPLIIIVVIAGIIGWLVFFRTPAQKAPAPSPEVQTGFGGEVFEKVGENPAAKMPETNPFNKEINPLENVYRNPFE